MSARVRRLGRCAVLLAFAGCGAVETIGTDTDDGSSGAGAAGTRCVERPLEVTGDDETEIGVSPAELMTLLDRDHTSIFTWAGGSTTVLRMKVEHSRVFSVRSRVNGAPYQGTPTAQQCADHVRVEAGLSLTTADEQLAERVDEVVLYAYGSDELRGSFKIAKGELGGNYAPSIRSQHCFEYTSFRLLFATNGAHGSMVDTLSAVSCESMQTAGTLEFAAGHWGSRWKNY